MNMTDDLWPVSAPLLMSTIISLVLFVLTILLTLYHQICHLTSVCRFITTSSLNPMTLVSSANFILVKQHGLMMACVVQVAKNTSKWGTFVHRDVV